MKKGYFNIDWQLVIPVFVLTIISLTTLFSLNISLFKNQLIYLFISFCIFFLFSQAQYKFAKFYVFPVYVISLILLAIVLVIGYESRGAVRWIEFFGLQIQFSEILKPFLALIFSSFLVEKGISFKTFILSIIFFMPIAFLIFLQPDLGNTLLYTAVLLFTLFAFGFPYLWFIGLFLMVSAFTPMLWHFLHDYQRQRILTFLHPAKDPLGSSYNAIQSIIAIGSGMFFGKGLSQGSQSGLRFLPERHTDFIFASISESLGFVGSVLVLISFVFLLYRIFRICSYSDDAFCKTFSLCCFFLILLQTFVNIGMNTGILPVVGVTLPFVSYGGSSLLSNFILLGFLSSIHRETREEKALEIK